MGVLGIKTMSYITCMSRYSYALWAQMSEVLDKLPMDKKTKGRFLPKEGMLLGKQFLMSAKHILNLFAETITSAVCLHCHAWLRSTDLQQDTKVLIEDLPFEGKGLLSYTFDLVLQDLDKSIKASRTRKHLHQPRASSQESGLGHSPGTHIPVHHQITAGTPGLSNHPNLLIQGSPFPRCLNSPRGKPCNSQSRVFDAPAALQTQHQHPSSHYTCFLPYLLAWEAITSDRWVFSIIREEYSIKFKEEPPIQVL